ncbi:MAG: hypothetical protein HFF01_07830 [Erysipelotrichaceae bacterium]|nr:hypothetical protein [Erysipelotrichaceae bacterium]
MFETAKKYSETTYYNKQALEQELEHYLVEPLWNEITQYRQLFKQDFSIHGKKTFLVRNPLVNDTMAQLQELFFQWLSIHQEDPYCELDLFWLKEQEQLRFASLYAKMRYDKKMDEKTLLEQVIKGFQLESEISSEQITYLMNEKNNLLLKLFMIAMEGNRRSAFLLFYPILYMHHVLPLANMFQMEEVVDHMMQIIQESDITLHFLSMLTYLQTKFQDSMNAYYLQDDASHSSLNLDAQELIERYPMLQKESIHFYVSHRKPHHFYTLQDYIQACGVCYETARYSMEKFVTLKWYQKQKAGKKFVYFI